MPITLRGAGTAEYTLAERKYDYDYPRGLDLRPGSELHERIKSEVMTRAQESRSVVQSRFESWGKVDRTLTAYVPLDKKEKEVQAEDERKPVSIVVPISYAVLDTLLSYWMAAFLEEPYFRYEGHGPEDVLGAIMMEKIIDLHCKRLKVGLQLYTMWRDALVYGYGIVSPIWHKQVGLKASAEREGFLSRAFGSFVTTGYKRVTGERVLFEGNRLVNIDPYAYLPDPNVPIHDVQAGEFSGWVDHDNLMSLLERERSDESLFNVRYLRHLRSGRSKYGTSESKRSEMFSLPSATENKTHPVDTIYMYINLIPKDWKLGDSEYPEKWFFGLSSDKVVIAAQPIGLNHGLYPICVCSPAFDGYSVTPISEVEVTYGLQQTIDWFFSSHITNVRKSLHDMFVVDPSMVFMKDLKQSGPTRFIRLRRTAWGKSALDNAVKQLSVTDVTRQNVSDVTLMIDIINRVVGASDQLQGVMRQTSERRTATEVRGARGGAISRLEKSARIGGMQAMYDIAYMFAMHTQQLMSEDVYVKSTGNWEDLLRKEYGREDSKYLVRPQDILVDYDIVPRDGSVPSGDFADSWINLFAIAAKNPAIAGKFDMVRVFKHIARLMGAKNLEEFVMKGPEVRTSVMPEEELARGVEAGNLVPLEEYSGGEAAGF